MPPAIALLAGGAAAGAGTGAGIGSLLLGTVGRLALGVGISLIAQRLLRPKPKPSEGQVETTQPVPPRSFVYGRMKISGPLAFYETTQDILFKLVMLGCREYDAVEEYYLGDKLVTIDGSGYVTVPEEMSGFVQTTTYLGTDSQAADFLLSYYFPDQWTAYHQLLGIAYVVLAFTRPGSDAQDFSRVFPSGEPSFMALVRGAKVYDPRLDGTIAGGVGAHRQGDKTTWAWSDNVALCILDFLTYEDGYDIAFAELDLPSFQAFANLCDEAVSLAAGGTENRYRVATQVYLTEARKEVLARLLEACDGVLYITAAGLIAIRGGEWVAPTITLDADLGHILGIQLKPPDRLDRYNELAITYLDTANGYVENEAEPWQELETGESIVSRPFDLSQVPSASQARRLAKIRMERENPEWLAEVATNFYGLNTITERAVNLAFPELLISGPFLLDEGPSLSPDFTGVNLRMRSVGVVSYDWTPALEEGSSPPIAPVIVIPLTYRVTEGGDYRITETADPFERYRITE